MNIFTRSFLVSFSLLVFLLTVVACGGSDTPALKVGGIPDQDASRLVRRYDGFADYLSAKLGVNVEYIPSADYAAVVTAFGQKT